MSGNTERFEKLEQTVVGTIPTNTLSICIAACASDCECSMFVWRKDLSICRLLKESGKSELSSNPQATLYYKLKANYWPIDGSTVDVIGKNDMKLELNAQLTSDRLGNP